MSTSSFKERDVLIAEEVLVAVESGIDLFDSSYPSFLQSNCCLCLFSLTSLGANSKFDNHGLNPEFIDCTKDI